MNTLTRGVVVLAGATALAATSVLAGCEVSFLGSPKHETRTYDVAGSFSGLKIDGSGGRVEVVGTGTDRIRVEERASWTHERNKPRTQQRREGGTLALSTKCAHQVIGWNGCGMSYRIEVPKATMADLHTDSGPLEVSGLTGDRLRLSADSGSISAERVHTKTLSVDADSGSIRVAGQAESVELENDSGKIDADGLRAERVRVRVSSGSVKLTMLNAPASLDVDVDSGGVKARLPTTASYAITMESDSGGQEVSPSLRRDPASRHRVDISSSSGSISIEALGGDSPVPVRPERPDPPDAPERP